jgi:hypothetical protein
VQQERTASFLRDLVPPWIVVGLAVAFAFLFLDRSLDPIAYAVTGATVLLALVFLILVAGHPRSQRSAAELGFESDEDLAAWRDGQKGAAPIVVLLGIFGTIVLVLGMIAGTTTAYIALACNILLLPYERFTRRYPGDRWGRARG